MTRQDWKRAARRGGLAWLGAGPISAYGNDPENLLIKQEDKMQKWEYAFGSYTEQEKEWVTKAQNKIYSSVAEMLADMGKNGWELVSVSTYVTYNKPSFSQYVLIYTNQEYFYFKRPIS
jgi:hypothetical protein